MLTTRDAAHLLAGPAPDAGRGAACRLEALSRALGFAAPLMVGRTARRRFGLEDPGLSVSVAAGAAGAAGHHPAAAAGGSPAGSAPGALRALLIESRDGTALTREQVVRAARAAAREAAANLWLVLARDAASGALVIAAPAPGGSGPVAALSVDPTHVLDSDAETFASLAANSAAAEPALLVHLHWRETLGRDALSRRFYRELEGCVERLAATAQGDARTDARTDTRTRRTIALLFVSRLLFLAFLEAKGWLDGDRNFLRRRFEAACGGRGAHHRLLLPLFFGTLNTPARRRAPAARALGRVPFLNGGLFTRTPLERRHCSLRFTDEALSAVVGGLLGRYRLTAREASAEWTDAAVDPEMLGRAFESLMVADERRAAGAFYTPHALIVRLTSQALGAAGTHTLEELDAVRLVDPACGSGAFLVHALETLADRRTAAGDRRELGDRRRHVLTHCIFGVDRDPTAVWLCQLRLWLSVVVDDEALDPARLLPLPNLDRNVREGDALAGAAFAAALLDPRAGGRDIEALRLRYARASGARKRTLARALDRAERSHAMDELTRGLERENARRRDILLAVRSPDLFRTRRGPDETQRQSLAALRDDIRTHRGAIRRLREGGALPFSFATHFPDVAQRGGFSLVLGNPPWVRPHAMALTKAERDLLRSRFVVYRRAAWLAGAQAAGAGRGFASQADLAAIFTERATQLIRPGGVIALLLPSKLWIALAGGGLRELLAREVPVLSLEDWSDEVTGFDATVYPSALVARRGAAAGGDVEGDVAVTMHRRGRSTAWRTTRSLLALDETPGAPWLLLPPAARAAHAAMTRAGTPLAESVLGRPMLGVKSGCNEAFIVTRCADDALGDGALGEDAPDGDARVCSGRIEDLVERSSLRPVLRGEHLRAWRHEQLASRESIIWTHDPLGVPVATLPRHAHRWLGRWRRRLEQRTDARGARWWSLFRTDAARADRPRVVWGDIGRAPRAIVLPAGDPTVPLNSCYVIRARTSDDAHALAALLNSDVALAWLAALAEPARGGYLRFLGWTCARLPVPRDWSAARAVLAPLGRAAAAGDAPTTTMLTDAVLGAYGIDHREVAALLRWTSPAEI